MTPEQTLLRTIGEALIEYSNTELKESILSPSTTIQEVVEAATTSPIETRRVLTEEQRAKIIFDEKVSTNKTADKDFAQQFDVAEITIKRVRDVINKYNSVEDFFKNVRRKGRCKVEYYKLVAKHKENLNQLLSNS